MPQINLLSKETKDNSSSVVKMFSLLARLLALVFFVVLGYYGYLWYQSKNISSDILSTQDNIKKIQNEILNHENRKEVLVRQGQLSAVSKILAGHPYWSKMFPELARVTLKSAYYTSFNADEDGKLKLTVIVPSYTEFDTYLQVFNLPEFNKNFSNVRVTSVNKYQVGNITGVKFDVEMDYNQDFLKQSF